MIRIILGYSEKTLNCCWGILTSIPIYHPSFCTTRPSSSRFGPTVLVPVLHHTDFRQIHCHLQISQFNLRLLITSFFCWNGFRWVGTGFSYRNFIFWYPGMWFLSHRKKIAPQVYIWRQSTCTSGSRLFKGEKSEVRVEGRNCLPLNILVNCKCWLLELGFSGLFSRFFSHSLYLNFYPF